MHNLMCCSPGCLSPAPGMDMPFVSSPAVYSCSVVQRGCLLWSSTLPFRSSPYCRFRLHGHNMAPGNDDPCAKLASLALSGAKVVSATTVAAGAFVPPDPAALQPTQRALMGRLPQFCRIQVVATPSIDSSIPIEVWLPVKGWNGKFRGQGNGGFAGSIDFLGPAVAVMQGYATGATDTGHSGGFGRCELGTGSSRKGD